ncbi:MAG: dTDP-4-dehydrorhamnose 3,5-epimerase, partial [Bdellovibrionota bacterium]
KLVSCVRGKVLDVVVDLRKKASTFGQHCAVELSGDTASWLWVPPGFAHGFAVLSDDGAEVWYKVDQDYNSKGEGGVLWNDPTLAIDWRIREPVLSDRDRTLPSFADYSRQPFF